MVVKFEISMNNGKVVDYEKTIKAPSINTAIMKLALECDLNDVSAIYINNGEENDD